MSIFTKLSDYVYYLRDSFASSKPNVKIESFGLTENEVDIQVFYIIGHHRILSKKSIANFEMEFFDFLSAYDKTRLIKFSTLNKVYKHFFSENQSNKNEFLLFLEKEFDNEQLF